MPIYEYACRSCEHRFEELVSRHGTLVACPQCTSGEVSQLLSTFSARTVGGDPPCCAPPRAAAAAVAAAAAAAVVTESRPGRRPRRRVGGCTNCALAASRTLVVAGEGPMPAELMLVADAPGFHDDRLGRPLVGPAGELLADLLASIGLERRDVYVTTLVKCRPPGTQSPAPEEIAACRDKLERQVALVRPRVVVGARRSCDARARRRRPRRLAGARPGAADRDRGHARWPCCRSTIPLPRSTTRACCLRSQADVPRLGELLGRTAVAPARRSRARPCHPIPQAVPDEQQLGLF